MRSKLFFLCVSLVTILICSCQPEFTAEMVLQKSLEEAHGGKALWEASKTLIYEKTTTFYDSEGNVENIKKQTFHNTLQPTFTSKVKWMEGDVEKRIVFDGKDTFIFIDGYQVTDDEKVKAAYKEIMGAQYVLWQPYKLVADEASLTYEGIVLLEDKTYAHVIKAMYPDSDTIWWYYFDMETYVLKENLVQHNSTRYSQIINISHEETTGLRLHQERKSFAVDVGKNDKYLRATYHYNILTLE